jgi:hypothetical protein
MKRMSDAPKTTASKNKKGHGGPSSKNKVNFTCTLRKLFHSILTASTLLGEIPILS